MNGPTPGELRSTGNLRTTISVERQTALIAALLAGAGLSFFGLIELLYGSRLTAALDLTFGLSFLAIGVGILFGSARIVLTRLFIIALILFGFSILLLSGGQSRGTLLALPTLMFVISMIESRRWVLPSCAAMLALVVMAALLRDTQASYPITYDADWIAASAYRTPTILGVIAVFLAYYFRLALERAQERAVAAEEYSQEAYRRADYNRARLRDLSEQAADWFWEADHDGQFTFVSPGFEKKTGIPISRALGKRPWEVLAGFEDNEPEAEPLRELWLSGQGFEEREVIWRRPGGAPVTMLVTSQPYIDSNGSVMGFRGVVRDVTEAYGLSESLRRLADTDELTGLLNRRAFGEKADRSLRAIGAKRQSFALAMIDLDHFKPVNDQAGHASGDALLKRVARHLTVVAKDGIAGRLGGDEFALVWPGLTGPVARSRCEDLLAAIRNEVVDGPGRVFQVTASIGLVAEEPVESIALEDWLKRADDSVYEAKRGGRNQVVIADG